MYCIVVKLPILNIHMALLTVRITALTPETRSFVILFPSSYKQSIKELGKKYVCVCVCVYRHIIVTYIYIFSRLYDLLFIEDRT